MESSLHQQYCLRWNNHSTNLQSEFHDLLQKEAFTDAVLVVDDGSELVSLKCHKMILAACSTLFQDLFTKASSNEQYMTLLMPDVKGWEMKAILEYMYHGEICILSERIDDLLEVAKMLKIKGLTDDESQNSRERTPSPPPTISSTESNTVHNGRSSPLHSTSSYHPVYGTSPAAYMSGWNDLSDLSMVAESLLNPLLAHRSTTLFPSACESTSKSGHNRDTKILRTTLDQGYADSSQSLCTSVDDSLNLPAGLNGHSAFTADVSSKKSTKKRASQKPTHRKSSGKNYKMYTKEQMDLAIKQVAQGACALSVAIAMRIPSRTLYDKVRKLGIKRNGNGGRYRRTSGAHSPHGTEGNSNDNIYIDVSDARLTLLDIAYGPSRQSSDTSDASLDNLQRSPSPDDEQPLKMEEDIDIPDDVQKSVIEHGNEAQDLSVHRSNVIVSPSHHHIKEEKNDSPQD